MWVGGTGLFETSRFTVKSSGALTDRLTRLILKNAFHQQEKERLFGWPDRITTTTIPIKFYKKNVEPRENFGRIGERELDL